MDLPTDLNRDQAIDWAIREAQRIAVGDYNGEPMGIFNAAQRMEVVLTQPAWTDGDFPRR